MKFTRALVFTTGFAAGYVTGSAAGRARYEQIVSAAQRAASETGLVAAKDRLGQRSGDIARTAADEAAHATRGVVETATDRVDSKLVAAQDAIGAMGTSDS